MTGVDKGDVFKTSLSLLCGCCADSSPDIFVSKNPPLASSSVKANVGFWAFHLGHGKSEQIFLVPLLVPCQIGSRKFSVVICLG